jgi:hypothetical protein
MRQEEMGIVNLDHQRGSSPDAKQGRSSSPSPNKAGEKQPLLFVDVNLGVDA